MIHKYIVIMNGAYKISGGQQICSTFINYNIYLFILGEGVSYEMLCCPLVWTVTQKLSLLEF